jgi:hypothetical protein
MNIIREEWIFYLRKIVDPVFDALYSSNLKNKIFINSDIGYFEAFARAFAGIAPWIALHNDKSPEELIRADYLSKIIVCFDNILNNTNPDFIFIINNKQAVVESAYITQAFIRFPNLWHAISSNTQKLISDSFLALRKFFFTQNNWILFSAMIEAFFFKFNIITPDLKRIDEAFNKCNSWYLHDGWYKDGDKFHMDYYNSFVFHSMLVDIAACFPKFTNLYNLFIKRMVRYSEFLERLIAPDGSFPPFGRSVVYRSACFQSLAHTVFINNISSKLSLGQIKAALTAVFHRLFSDNYNFNADGFLTLGFNGNQSIIADSYSNIGSTYLATIAFLPLGLPDNHPFWMALPEEWTQVKAWYGKTFTNDKYVDF